VVLWRLTISSQGRGSKGEQTTTRSGRFEHLLAVNARTERRGASRRTSYRRRALVRNRRRLVAPTLLRSIHQAKTMTRDHVAEHAACLEHSAIDCHSR